MGDNKERAPSAHDWRLRRLIKINLTSTTTGGLPFYRLSSSQSTVSSTVVCWLEKLLPTNTVIITSESCEACLSLASLAASRCTSTLCNYSPHTSSTSPIIIHDQATLQSSFPIAFIPQIFQSNFEEVLLSVKKSWRHQKILSTLSMIPSAIFIP